METKNAIIQNLTVSLADMVRLLMDTTSKLNENLDENIAIIKTININLESLRSQIVIIQQTVDSYEK